MNQTKNYTYLFLIILGLVLVIIFSLLWTPFIYHTSFSFYTNQNECFEDIQNNKQQKIPKVIHQIWLDSDSSIQQARMNTWKVDYIKEHPDYIYIFWNKNKIDKLDWLPRLRHIYDVEKDPRGKSDIVKLLILHQMGGIVIDPNTVWVNKSNLDDLIEKAYQQNNNMFLGREPNQNWVGNSVIGSVKKHTALAFLLNKLEEISEGYSEIRGKTPTWIVTGPVFVNRAIMDNYPITIFPEFTFTPMNKNIKETTFNSANSLKTYEPRNTVDDYMILENLPKLSYMYNYDY
jgi:mannosyltransferase OCH1-like enzyme